eukprot:scaffold57187_cov70-Phaeocystis_antarctica.AAC.7
MVYTGHSFSSIRRVHASTRVKYRRWSVRTADYSLRSAAACKYALSCSSLGTPWKPVTNLPPCAVSTCGVPRAASSGMPILDARTLASTLARRRAAGWSRTASSSCAARAALPLHPSARTKRSTGAPFENAITCTSKSSLVTTSSTSFSSPTRTGSPKRSRTAAIAASTSSISSLEAPLFCIWSGSGRHVLGTGDS